MKKLPFLLLKIIFYLISLLPFKVIYYLSDILYFVLYRVISYRTKTVLENLRNSFPDKTEEQIQQIAEKFYRFLSDQLLESIKMLTISRENVKRRFRINNLEELTQHFEQDKAVIGITGHYGNWEWGGLILSILIEKPVIIIYKPISNKLFERFINNMRSRFNAVLAPMKNTLRKVMEYKSKPYLMILVSDQTPAKADIRHFTRFLNQRTPVFEGAEKLSKITGNPVVYCHIDRCKRGFYECTFSTLSDNPCLTAENEITRLFFRKLENIIRAKPELWLWSHRRWKYSIPFQQHELV